jgi:hypothetical protein
MCGHLDLSGQDGIAWQAEDVVKLVGLGPPPRIPGRAFLTMPCISRRLTLVYGAARRQCLIDH